MTLIRDGDPVSELVTLDLAKAHLRVDGDDEDSLITNLIAAAIAHLDGPRGVLGRCVQPQRWRLMLLDGWSNELRLPLPHAEEITADQMDGDLQVMEVPIMVRSCGLWSLVRPVSTTADPVRIRFTAGVPEDILPALRQAALLIIGNWYLNREEVVTGVGATALPLSAQRILAPLKIGWTA